MPEILVIDDEPAIRESVGYALRRDGFSCVEAGSLAEARASRSPAALIVLDLMLTDGSGLDFLRELRRASDTPVIVLTSRDEETDRVALLELGADDYVTKPFSPRELVARVRAVLRRVGKRPEADLETLRGPHGLELAPSTRRASVASSALALSRTEFDLLQCFMRSPGQVFSRARLLERVWEDIAIEERTVDVHVKALRKKLADAGAPDAIETVRGVGYRLKEP